MPLPANFMSSFGLDLGLGGSSTALSGATAAPITNEGWTGPFAVGSGADARQSNNLPINNNTTPGAGTPVDGAMFAGMGNFFNPQTAVTVILLLFALGYAKKKGLI